MISFQENSFQVRSVLRTAVCMAVSCCILLSLQGGLEASSTSSTYVGTAVAKKDYFAYGPTIVNDNGKYKMWYGGDWPGLWGDRILYCESNDGQNWGNPVVALAPTIGSRDGYYINDPSVVIKTETAPRSSAAASSQISGWPASSTIDGNSGTCWSGNWHSTAYATEWLELNFGSTIGVNAITLTPRYNGYCFPVDFKLQYYDGSWKDISGQSYTNYPNPGGVTPQEFKFPTVKGSKVRVYATKLGVDDYGNHYMQMAEFNATKATFYMYYTGSDQQYGQFNHIFLATSSDGTSWTKYAPGGTLTPVLEIPGYKMKTLADFENGVDSRWGFYAWNYNGPSPAMNYAWSNPYNDERTNDDINYWDTWDDGDGFDGFLDANFYISSGDRNWNDYQYMFIKWYAWTTRGTAGKVQIYAHNASTGQFYHLGYFNLPTGNQSSKLSIDISSIPRSNIDFILIRTHESYFSDLQTTTNRQRNHIYNIQLSATSQCYGVGQSSVLTKDGYFWQYFSDRNSGGAERLFLARSSNGTSWTRMNGGNQIYNRSCADVKYIASANKYYMVYGEVGDNKLYWNISSSMTSWPSHSSSRRINVSPSDPSIHNAGLLGDGNGHMSTTSKCYYGAGTVQYNPFLTICDIDLSNITVTP